ncbi:hypothetical protein [Bdellovibrio sp. GT3]|uniref:hypothetical protein n=1 Tax=Bdellovibrio sp. GT3 TaxID=3136282 RepID=UPI0030F1BB3A
MNIEKLAAYFTVASIGASFIFDIPSKLTTEKQNQISIESTSKAMPLRTQKTPRKTAASIQKKEISKFKRIISSQEFESGTPISRSEADQAIIDRVRSGLKNGEYTK